MQQHEIGNKDSTSLKIIMEASGNVLFDSEHTCIHMYVYVCECV